MFSYSNRNNIFYRYVFWLRLRNWLCFLLWNSYPISDHERWQLTNAGPYPHILLGISAIFKIINTGWHKNQATSHCEPKKVWNIFRFAEVQKWKCVRHSPQNVNARPRSHNATVNCDDYCAVPRKPKESTLIQSFTVEELGASRL